MDENLIKKINELEIEIFETFNQEKVLIWEALFTIDSMHGKKISLTKREKQLKKFLTKQLRPLAPKFRYLLLEGIRYRLFYTRERSIEARNLKNSMEQEEKKNNVHMYR